jgi:hypothetical protein
MNALFKTMGISKQAFHQYHERLNLRLALEADLRVIIMQIRKDHPTMGCRDMYHMIDPEGMGRDLFEEFCRCEGFMAKPVRNYRRTTDSSGVVRFDNLAKNLVLSGINQLWASDITYFEVAGKFHYITFIEDVFSRRIIGYKASERLKTESTTLPALQMAIKTRMKEGLRAENVILHSDGGGQYYDRLFLELTHANGFQNSMCVYPWENPYAERINGTIKNNYLAHRHIVNYSELTREVDRAVKLYNERKPHKSLNRLTPLQFERLNFGKSNKTEGEESTENKEVSELVGLSPAGLEQ